MAERGAPGRGLTRENGQVRLIQSSGKSVADKESSQNPRGRGGGGGLQRTHGQASEEAGGGGPAGVGAGLWPAEGSEGASPFLEVWVSHDERPRLHIPF